MRDHGKFISRFNANVKGQISREQVQDAIDEAGSGGGSAEADRWKENLLKQAGNAGDQEAENGDK